MPKDGDRAIAAAQRAFQRNQRIALDSAFGERQYGFELLPVGADIAAGQSEQRRRLVDQFRVDPGIGESQLRGLDDAGTRAGEVGADVGGAALGARQDNACQPSRPPPGNLFRRHQCPEPDPLQYAPPLE